MNFDLNDPSAASGPACLRAQSRCLVRPSASTGGRGSSDRWTASSSCVSTGGKEGVGDSPAAQLSRSVTVRRSTRPEPDLQPAGCPHPSEEPPCACPTELPGSVLAAAALMGCGVGAASAVLASAPPAKAGDVVVFNATP